MTTGTIISALVTPVFSFTSLLSSREGRAERQWWAPRPTEATLRGPSPSHPPASSDTTGPQDPASLHGPARWSSLTLDWPFISTMLEMTDAWRLPEGSMS